MAKWDKNKLRVAVTGVGGGRGIAILKALKLSSLPLEIYPVDVTPRATGLHTGIGGTVLPRPEQDLDAWRRWALNWGINAIIPGSDYDLAPFAAVREHWQRDWQIELLVNPLFAVEVANSKAQTGRILEELGVQVPTQFYFEKNPTTTQGLSASAELALRWMDGNSTCVIKPDFGMGSQHIVYVHSLEEYFAHIDKVPNPVVQEYIEGDEFTCGLFFDATSTLKAHFIMRRWLKKGDTHIAEAGDFPAVSAFIRDFAEKTRGKFQWRGVVNLQVIQHPTRGIFLIEINAGCSGSTAMRASFGYNEPEMLLRQFLLHEAIEQPLTSRGVALRAPTFVTLYDVSLEQLDELTRGMKGTWL